MFKKPGTYSATVAAVYTDSKDIPKSIRNLIETGALSHHYNGSLHVVMNITDSRPRFKPATVTIQRDALGIYSVQCDYTDVTTHTDKQEALLTASMYFNKEK